MLTEQLSIPSINPASRAMGAQGWRQRRRKRIRKHPVRQSWISLDRGNSVIKVFVGKA